MLKFSVHIRDWSRGSLPTIRSWPVFFMGFIFLCMEDKLNDKLIIIMPDGRLVTLTDEQIKNMFSNCLTANNLDKMFNELK